MTWLFWLGIGLAANLLAEAFIRQNLQAPIVQHMSIARSRVRWAVVPAGLCLCAWSGLSTPGIVFVALFAVTAAVDFETSYLPPDWYLYGCTAANIAIAWFAGPDVFRGVVVTQAICFALAVVLAYAGAWAGGDVKLMMQYGASAGALATAGIAMLIEQVLRVVFVLFALAKGLAMWRGLRPAWAAAKQASVGPHGGVAFVGLVCAIAWRAAWG
jgi:hypothetical protein